MSCNYPGIKLEPALQKYDDKTEHLSSYAHVVHTTAKQVISRRRKNENVFKMSKDENCTCKACKNNGFHCQICKFVGILLQSSSWLLKLPNRSFHVVERTRTSTRCAKMKYARAKRAKLFFYCQICKFVTFLLRSSSWLLKLPIYKVRSAVELMSGPLRKIQPAVRAGFCSRNRHLQVQCPRYGTAPFPHLSLAYVIPLTFLRLFFFSAGELDRSGHSGESSTFSQP